MTGKFRADQVGSLLRPEALLAARRGHDAGEVTGAGLREAEDQAIATAVGRQEAKRPSSTPSWPSSRMSRGRSGGTRARMIRVRRLRGTAVAELFRTAIGWPRPDRASTNWENST
jgi:hypothetical protein